jgi:hypothetical protein
MRDSYSGALAVVCALVAHIPKRENVTSHLAKRGRRTRCSAVEYCRSSKPIPFLSEAMATDSPWNGCAQAAEAASRSGHYTNTRVRTTVKKSYAFLAIGRILRMGHPKHSS